jgi:hypothetical protein
MCALTQLFLYIFEDTTFDVSRGKNKRDFLHLLENFPNNAKMNVPKLLGPRYEENRLGHARGRIFKKICSPLF